MGFYGQLGVFCFDLQIKSVFIFKFSKCKIKLCGSFAFHLHTFHRGFLFWNHWEGCQQKILCALLQESIVTNFCLQKFLLHTLKRILFLPLFRLCASCNCRLDLGCADGYLDKISGRFEFQIESSVLMFLSVRVSRKGIWMLGILCKKWQPVYVWAQFVCVFFMCNAHRAFVWLCPHLAERVCLLYHRFVYWCEWLCPWLCSIRSLWLCNFL